MKISIICLSILFFFNLNMLTAQKFDRRRQLSIRDQLQMKVDSINQIYLSKLHSREHFEAKRQLDGVIQLFDKREFELQQREQALQERERILEEREQALQQRNKEWDRDRDNDRDKIRDKNRDHDRADNHPLPISQDEFGQLLQVVDNASFAQDKKRVVKTSVLSHYFMVDQLIRLASKFSFDNDKLEVVETVYPKLLDLDKNYLLYNCFTFSDAKTKLEKFIEENNANPANNGH